MESTETHSVVDGHAFDKGISVGFASLGKPKPYFLKREHEKH